MTASIFGLNICCLTGESMEVSPAVHSQLKFALCIISHVGIGLIPLKPTRNWKLVIDIPTNWVKNSTDCKSNAFFGSVSGQTGWVLRKISLLLLPQNKMLPERIVGAGVFGEGFENSIKFILHGLS